MNPLRLIRNGLRFHWRTHLSVLPGILLATAVLTGALLTGDSVKGSLRRFALQRLGGIRQALFTPSRFFSQDLAARISGDTAAVLLLKGMAITEEKQINRVQVLGCGPAFWNFAGLDFDLQPNETALGWRLAAELGVEAGDEISLRIGKPGLLPGDAPLASQKEDRSVRGLFFVKRVLGDDELGRFSLSANQTAPFNAFVNLQALQNRTELTGKANLLLTGSEDPDLALARAWEAADFSLHFRKDGPLVQLESDQVYLDPATARAALSVPGAEGTLTYLVNSLSADQKSTPYSFVIARDGTGLADDEIRISSWLAETLGAKEGDPVRMTWSALLPSNRFEERQRDFRVRSIIEMSALEQERRLAPQFPGLTDVDRCTDWDAGLPMEEDLLADEANEAYWNEYRQTPKAMVSLRAGQDMWSNRFGSLTSVRWPDGAAAEAGFRETFDPAEAGFFFLPVREQALAAVESALDFGQLFAGMSFFLIVAALMLTGLLFVFGVQQRAEETGILLATGWRPRAVRNLFLSEGAVIALIGSLIGTPLGTGFTRLLLYGLARPWRGAVADSSIQYFAAPGTAATGAAAGFLCAMCAIGIAAWRQAGHPPRELLAADFTQELQPLRVRQQANPARLFLPPLAALLIAAGIAAYALLSDIQTILMPFFGAGALLLTAGILFCGAVMRTPRRQGRMSGLRGLALRNIIRRRTRSLTVIGLLASGCFLVLAVSSMKEDVTAQADQPGSGTGGFKWIGESTLPIRSRPGDVQLRVRDGDDASCLNLNRALLPRLLGVDPNVLSERRAFSDDTDVWKLLQIELPDGIIPALAGDADTALWGLQAKTGIDQGALLEYTDESGTRFRIRLVGTLPMRRSVFQGSVLIDEKHFVEKFSGEEGYRMFLFAGDPGEASALRSYERAGLDLIPAVDRLLEFHAVESTYLSMFLVLGGLGLAVGSLGLGAVVLRNIQERRAELALLQAVGFRAAELRSLLGLEHGLLLAAGLMIGTAAAAAAMVPALFISKTQIQYNLLLAVLFTAAACGILCIAAAVRTASRGDVLKGLRNE